MRTNIARTLTLLFFAASLTAPVYAAGNVSVGGKDFTEQLLMAEITTEYLRAQGFEVDKRDGMGSTMLRKAQENGQIDIYWEYTGTSLAIYNKVEAKDLESSEAIEKVRSLDQEQGLTWLDCSDANNTWAIAVKNGKPTTEGIEAISDLADAYRKGRNLQFGVTSESAHRNDGLPGVEKAYEFDVPRAQTNMMAVGLYMSALREGKLDASFITSTDGRIEAFDLRTLEDDKQFFPNYAMCPVVRTETLERHPELEQHLEKLASTLDDSVMRRLNSAVDVDRKPVSQVAQNFLERNDLI